MSTFTGTNKSNSIWNGTNKSNSVISYLLTDALEQILVGATETDILLLSEGVTWTGVNKS
jgi:hypothetical protein